MEENERIRVLDTGSGRKFLDILFVHQDIATLSRIVDILAASVKEGPAMQRFLPYCGIVCALSSSVLRCVSCLANERQECDAR